MERYRYKDSSAAWSGTETAGEHGSAGEQNRFLRDGAARADEAAHTMSVIGKTLVFKGELTANEDLLIQGRVEGAITHTATNLAIGAHGDVKANITGRRVIIQGKVEGDVRASESIIVEVSANVRGNLIAPRVSLKDGAKFRGRIDMDTGNESAGDTQRLPNPGKRSKSKMDLSADNVDEILS